MNEDVMASPHYKQDAMELAKKAKKQELSKDPGSEKSEATPNLATKAVTALLNALSNADVDAAVKRVENLKEEHETKTLDELAELLIKKKVQQTATIGAASSSTALIPGLGTLTSLTVGVATDITATFKLQAEMVLELASLYNFELSTLDQQKLVYLVTGVSTGSNVLLGKVGKELTVKMTERYAQKWLSTALPIIGIAASSSTNALSTYVIAERAKAYFKDGPEAVTTWQESLRRISGVDERTIAAWLKQSSSQTGQALSSASTAVGQAVLDISSATGQAIMDAGSATGQAIATGANQTVQGIKDISSSTFEMSANVLARASDVLKLPFAQKEDEADTRETDIKES